MSVSGANGPGGGVGEATVYLTVTELAPPALSSVATVKVCGPVVEVSTGAPLATGHAHDLRLVPSCGVQE